MDAPFTIPLKTFWDWLVLHSNCILRAGNRDSILYDEEDLHWHFAARVDGALPVQVMRGKRVLAELFVESERISYVEALPPQNEGEHTFELISETESERFAAYFFVLTHGYQAEESAQGRVH